MRIRIEGHHLPGGTLQVGIQCRAAAVDLVPADSTSATWDVDCRSRTTAAGTDVTGPCVHGRPGARFLYLTWGTVGTAGTDGTFAMVRRAKLMLDAVPDDVLARASEPGTVLVARLSLTGADGSPVCAAVRPPAVEWSLEP